LATLVARRREAGASTLTFSVVFPYSTHNYLLRQWLASAGVDPDRDVRLTVAPPPRMAELLAAGVVEGFCAGEPWSAIAVAAGAGVVAARAVEIAPGAPDKVLGLTEAFVNANPDVASAVVRAIRRGLAWAQAPANRGSLALLLADPGYLDLPPDILQAGLRTVAFDEGRPTRDQGAWLVAQMRRWGQMSGDAVAAEGVYRPDLYDRALAEA
jgi:NitT/TauT family transport system ATP-binding protein/nitrate/nitrite transport system substrate-binding protein